MIYISIQNIYDLLRIYRSNLLFKDIIYFYVALYKEPYSYYFNENKNWSFSTQKYIPPNSEIQKHKKPYQRRRNEATGR